MNLKSFSKKHWAIIAILIIVLLGFYVRILNYNWEYLRNIDSYSFYRQIDEITQNNGILPEYDTLVLSPDINHRPWQILPYQYIAAWSYMMFRVFLPNLQLWQYLIYLPAMLAALAAIPMYFIGKTLFDKKVGVLAAFFIVFDISNISRSLGGDPDSDAIIILVPLIVFAVFLYTYKYLNEKNKFDKKSLLLTAIGGIILSLWAFIWAGYWYVVWIISGLLILKFIISIIKNKNLRDAWQTVKYSAISFAVMLCIVAIISFPFYGTSIIENGVRGPFEFGSIKSEENIKFPNVYVSVAELQESEGIKQIIQRTSVINFDQNPAAIFISPFFLMLYALIYLMYSYYKKGSHMDTFILLIIWFIGPLIATMVAVRFSILFSAPMAIGSAIILSKAWNMITKGEKLEE